jgi:hypothetical protein
MFISPPHHQQRWVGQVHSQQKRGEAISAHVPAVSTLLLRWKFEAHALVTVNQTVGIVESPTGFRMEPPRYLSVDEANVPNRFFPGVSAGKKVIYFRHNPPASSGHTWISRGEREPGNVTIPYLSKHIAVLPRLANRLLQYSVQLKQVSGLEQPNRDSSPPKHRCKPKVTTSPPG